MKFELTVDEKQLQVIREALEMYNRMGMGQLDIVFSDFRINNRIPVSEYDHKHISYHIEELKELLFGLEPNEGRGAYSDEVPQKCREAYDIIQVIRKEIAEINIKEAKEKGNTDLARHIAVTVDMREYDASNPEWPPVQIKSLT